MRFYYTKIMLKMLLEGHLTMREFISLMKEPKSRPRRALRNTNYDVDKLLEIVKEFKDLDPSEITIFFDMDNTTFKYSVDNNDLLSLKLQNYKGFFENLEAFDEAAEALKTLISLGYRVMILSSCCNDTFCMEGKRESIRRNFPFLKDEDIVFVMNGQNKAEEIVKRGIDITKSVLVDDYYVNLMNWMELGGLPIKKTFSGKQRPIPQVTDLREIEGILSTL